MNQPLISVIIPFYSTIPRLLVKAVHSALEQDYENIEVIVVDDCSPIKAITELSNLQDKRIKIIAHDINSNGGVARNTGIKNAKGQFVAFLDYDDAWYKDKLTKQLQLFLNNSSENNNIVIYSRCMVIDQNRSFIRPIRAIGKNESVGEYLFCSREIIQTSGLFLETSMAKKILFHDLKRHQDYQFCLSLEEVGCDFVMLEDVSYEFVQIPKLNDYNFSLMWLKNYSYLLNSKSINGFKSLVILRSIISHDKIFEAFKFAKKNSLTLSFIKVLIIKKVKKIITYFKYKVRND